MFKKRIFWIKSYVSYWLKAKTRFRIHSPFVFDLVESVFRDREYYADYTAIDGYKKKLSRSKSVIETTDFGKSGSEGIPVAYSLDLGKLVKQRSQHKAQAHLLYRLGRKFQPETVLELGTAAGFSASYIKRPIPQSNMKSLEGCPNLAGVAQDTFNKLNIKNIDVLVGDFDHTLPGVLKAFGKLDFVFFDGNHRKEATLDYFAQCVEKSTEESLFVFDDIHWSPGMAEAWDIIKKDRRVTLSIDLFWLGLVFFRRGAPKQDFIIRY